MEFIPTSNKESREDGIGGIILHFTAGGDIQGTIDWFRNPLSQSSAHYIVSRSSRTVQMVREELSAWHAGSRTTKPALNGKEDLNDWTIGIEICNWGYLLKADKDMDVPYRYKDPKSGQMVTIKRTRKKDTFYNFFYNWTLPYVGPDPIYHKVDSNIPLLKVPQECAGNVFWPAGNVVEWWEPYTKTQIQAVIEILQDIIKRNPTITGEWIAGHQDVDPTRKLDPGPAFPWEHVRNEVFKQNTVTISNKGDPLQVSYAEMLLNTDLERSC